MADKIKIVTHPVTSTAPKVWKDDKWVDANTTDVVVKVGGKIVRNDLPQDALTANIPDWSQDRSWEFHDVCYYNGFIYRANTPIDAGTPFVIGTSLRQWTLAVENEVTSIRDFAEFNPSLNKPISVGDTFRSEGDLYRCITPNTGQQINSAFFEKLTGAKSVPQINLALSYKQGDVVRWQGFEVAANSDLPSTQFQWGVGATQTWRPILSSGNLTMIWRGVASITPIQYNYGDVMAITTMATTLYVCISSNSTPYANTEVPPVEFWAPLVNNAPLTLWQYVSKSDNVNVKPFDLTKAYKANDIVAYGIAGYLYVAKNNVPAGTLLNSQNWLLVGGSGDVNVTTTAQRNQPGYWTVPTLAPKLYYDVDLSKMLLHRPGGSWAMFDGKYETITFPTNTTSYASPYGTQYIFDSVNKYWAVNYGGGGGSGAAGNRIMVTNTVVQSMGTGLNTMWVPNVELFKSGDLVLANGQITLFANRTYDITYELSVNATQTGTWCAYQIFDYTNNIAIVNQVTTSFWFSHASYNDQPVGRCTITVGSTNIRIGVRNQYNGMTTSGHTINGSRNSFSNDGGDSYLEVVEIGQSVVTDQRVNQITLDGTYADYLYATLNGNFTTAATTIQDIPFAKNLASFGEVTNTNGLFRLKGGRTYRLEASCSASVVNSSRYAYAWHDEANNRLPGTVGAMSGLASTENFNFPNVAVCIISPVNDINVKVRNTYSSSAAMSVYENDSSVGGSYASIQQIGSSKVITNVVDTGTGDPKNFVTRDTANNYNPSKHLVDFYFQSYAGVLSAADIALRCGATDAEKRARFWFLLQKFVAAVGGTDNDTAFDGPFAGVQAETNKQVSLNNAGMFANSLYTGGTCDIDPITYATVPTEWYKLILGRDAANNIWFVPVSPYYADGAAAGATSAYGIRYYNTGSTWSPADNPGTLPQLISCTGFAAGGTPTPINNLLTASQGALQYLPHRLELA